MIFLPFAFHHLVKSGYAAKLPSDLKREILEIIAYLHPKKAVSLTLVSKEVQEWIEKVIYRTVYFNGQRYYQNESSSTLSKFKRTIESRPASFFAEYVKTLHFDGAHSIEDVWPILQVCTGVTDFGCYARFETKVQNAPATVQADGEATGEGDGGETERPKTALDVYEYLHRLPLERLFLSLENLNALLLTSPVGRSSLQTLTYLAITDGSFFPIPRFPALTHVAIISPSDAENHSMSTNPTAAAKAQENKEKGIALIGSLLARSQTQSIVNMLNDTRSRQSNALWDINDERFVNFTLPMSQTKFVEDDLWDLAMTYPDEEEPVRYLEHIPYPRILTFEELMERERAQAQAQVQVQEAPAAVAAAA